MLNETRPVFGSVHPPRYLFSERLKNADQTLLLPLFREGGYAWQTQSELWTSIAGKVLRKAPPADQAGFLHEAVRAVLAAPWQGGKSLLDRFRDALDGISDAEVNRVLSCGEDPEALPSMAFLSVDAASKIDRKVRGASLVRNWVSGPEAWKRSGRAIEPGPRSREAKISLEECFEGWVCRVLLLGLLSPAAWEGLGEEGMRILARFHLPVCTFAASGKEFIPAAMQAAPTELAVTGSIPAVSVLAEQLLNLAHLDSYESAKTGTTHFQKTHLADCGFLLPRGFVRRLFEHCSDTLSLRAWGSDFTQCGLDGQGNPLPIGPALPGSTPLSPALQILMESNGGETSYNPHFAARKKAARSDVQDLVPRWAQAFPEELGRIAVVEPTTRRNTRPALDVIFGSILREPCGRIYEWQEAVVNALSRIRTVPVQSLETYFGEKRNAEMQNYGNTASVLAKWTGRLPANREEALQPDPLTGVPPAIKAISCSIHVMPSKETLFLVRDLSRPLPKTQRSFPETGLGAFSERLARSPKIGELGANALKRQAEFLIRFADLILDPKILSRQAVDAAGHVLPLRNASFLRTTLKWGDRDLAIQLALKGIANPALWDIEACLPDKPKENYPLWMSFLDTFGRYQRMDINVLKNYLRFGELASDAGRADILMEMKARAAKTSHADIAEELLPAIGAKLVKISLLSGPDTEDSEPIL
jgi:hypothetical protein